MVVVLVKEVRLVVVMDNLDFGVKDVVFEAMVFNKYGNFDWIANRRMENLGYTYLHFDLLDTAVLTTIFSKSNHFI